MQSELAVLHVLLCIHLAESFTHTLHGRSRGCQLVCYNFTTTPTSTELGMDSPRGPWGGTTLRLHEDKLPVVERLNRPVGVASFIHLQNDGRKVG